MEIESRKSRRRKRGRTFLWGMAYLALSLLFFASCICAEEIENTPRQRAGGGPFRIAYLDYDEYMPASRQFYYILTGMEEAGWIKEGSIPFTFEELEAKNLSTRAMYSALVEANLGPYISFVPGAFHYLAYEKEENIAEDLLSRAGEEIDLIFTFGTSAGVFVKNLNLPIPMMDYSATDPVASGIIASSTEGSGRANVWAHVEPSLPLRQLKFYHTISPFKKLGILIYGDETISGVPDIMASSEEIGFELVKYNIPEQPRETAEELEAYYDLVEEKIKELREEGIDAFFLTIDLINDLNRLYPLLSLFYERGIPVYLMDDVNSVERGGLLLICANDMENIGRFITDVFGQIANGATAGDLPCVYTSAPSIYLNYSVAKSLRYNLSFDFLASCDEIFTEGEEEE